VGGIKKVHMLLRSASVSIRCDRGRVGAVIAKQKNRPGQEAALKAERRAEALSD
jgi:hypothetical protein